MQKEYIIISCIGLGFIVINTKYKYNIGYKLLGGYVLLENKVINLFNNFKFYFRNYYYTNRKKTIISDGFKATEMFNNNIIYYKTNENEIEVVTKPYFISCFININDKDYELKLNDDNMNFYVSGNKILDYNFIKWLFRIQYNMYEFNDNYEVKLLDNNINEIKLTKINYVILDNTSYYIKENISYDIKGNIINSCNTINDTKYNNLNLSKINTSIRENASDTDCTSDDEPENDDGGVIII